LARAVSVLDLIGGTPTTELVHLAAGLPVPVFAKCEHLNPGGSVKDRIAKAIVEDAERRGALKPGATLVEATAGNTGIGLALVAAVKGYRLVCVMPKKMSPDKARALEAVGAEVIITADAPPSSPDNFQNVARRLADERGWFLTDQFNSAANVDVHYRTTGPEILAAVPGIATFVAAAGTGGTITGAGGFLRKHAVEIVLADPAGSALTDWVNRGELGEDGAYGVEGIGASEPPSILDRNVIDRAIAVSDEDSFATARDLIAKEGLLVGGSAGTAVAAALHVAKSADGAVVVLLPDSWDRYMSCDWMRTS